LLLQSYLRSANQQKKQLRTALKKSRAQAVFYASKSPHVLYPTFVGATSFTTPTRKKNAGPCLRLPPQEYWRLLKPPAINFDKERYAKFNYLLTLRIATRCRFTLLAFQP
jgi:hypothetical protein